MRRLATCVLLALLVPASALAAPPRKGWQPRVKSGAEGRSVEESEAPGYTPPVANPQAPASRSGSIYQYTDADGRLVFSDTLQFAPPSAEVEELEFSASSEPWVVQSTPRAEVPPPRDFSHMYAERPVRPERAPRPRFRRSMSAFESARRRREQAELDEALEEARDLRYQLGTAGLIPSAPVDQLEALAPFLEPRLLEKLEARYGRIER